MNPNEVLDLQMPIWAFILSKQAIYRTNTNMIIPPYKEAWSQNVDSNMSQNNRINVLLYHPERGENHPLQLCTAEQKNILKKQKNYHAHNTSISI